MAIAAPSAPNHTSCQAWLVPVADQFLAARGSKSPGLLLISEPGLTILDLADVAPKPRSASLLPRQLQATKRPNGLAF